VKRREWLEHLCNTLRQLEGLEKKYFRKGYKSAWVDVLVAWGPQFFWTATHEQQRTCEQWVRIMERMKRAAWKHGFSFRFFYVCEENKRGGFHLHALVKVEGDITNAYGLLRRSGDRIGGGMNKTERLEEVKQVVYVVKYMFKRSRGIQERYGFV